MSLLTVNSDDTICAIATPPGRGGIAVIRVSGVESYKILRKLMPSLPSQPTSHQVHYGHIDFKGDTVDEVLVTYFEKGRSFTGEQTVEISCHGSPVVTSNVLDALVEFGCRVAEPGEFTFRAFMNQRIDLVQAEGVLDLVESETRLGSNLAIRQLKGGLSERVSELEVGLTRVLAHVEANIDFAAEDIEIASESDLLEDLNSVNGIIDDLLKTYRMGKVIHDGIDVSIVGEPNVGKSSLLNSFSKEEKAIVTEVAGTTRDVVEGRFQYQGLLFNLFDTAGIRVSEDKVEKLGIERTFNTISECDVCLIVIDAACPVLPELEVENPANTFLVVNKSDLVGAEFVLPEDIKSQFGRDRIFFVSAKRNIGLVEVQKALHSQFALDSDFGHNALLTNSRHLAALSSAKDHVSKAIGLLKEEESPDLISFELMEALASTQSLLGKKFDDEVLDQVFRQFCLGK